MQRINERIAELDRMEILKKAQAGRQTVFGLARAWLNCTSTWEACISFEHGFGVEGLESEVVALIWALVACWALLVSNT